MDESSKDVEEPSPASATEIDAFEYRDSEHAVAILAGFQEQRSEGHFIDVTIRVDGRTLKAHRSVLSAFSRYFEALFRAKLLDSSSEVIEIDDLNGDAVEELVNFAYSGKLNVTPETVQDLLTAANYLCVRSAVDACCRFLVDNLNLNSCACILELAISLGLTNLRKATETYILAHIELMMREERLEKFSVDVLKQLLSRDEMAITDNGCFVGGPEQEEKVLELLVQLAEVNPEVHENLVHLLASCVRMLILPKATLKSLRESGQIDDQPECLDLVDRILSSSDDVSDENRERWERPRVFKVKYVKSTALAKDETPGHVVKKFDDIDLAEDGEPMYVTGMKIHVTVWISAPVIGAIEVFYSNGASVFHGSAECSYGVYEFHLRPGERITAVNAQTGWVIDQLQFATNQGSVFGPFGGDGGAPIVIHRPSEGAYLSHVTGVVEISNHVTTIRKLQFVWAVHEC